MIPESDPRVREEWLTVAEYAALKRVHHQTVRSWIRLGVVKAERTKQPRGHWRIRPRRESLLRQTPPK